MVRLPNPGNDRDVWGDLLNNFLLTIHTAQGELKPGVVSLNHLDTALAQTIASQPKIVSLTQTQYDNLTVYDPNTLYIIL